MLIEAFLTGLEDEIDQVAVDVGGEPPTSRLDVLGLSTSKLRAQVNDRAPAILIAQAPDLGTGHTPEVSAQRC